MFAKKHRLLTPVYIPVCVLRLHTTIIRIRVSLVLIEHIYIY